MFKYISKIKLSRTKTTLQHNRKEKKKIKKKENTLCNKRKFPRFMCCCCCCHCCHSCCCWSCHCRSISFLSACHPNLSFLSCISFDIFFFKFNLSFFFNQSSNLFSRKFHHFSAHKQTQTKPQISTKTSRAITCVIVFDFGRGSAVSNHTKCMY